jgi:aminoglycoside phosphotransferase (APT) family kinase protein
VAVPIGAKPAAEVAIELPLVRALLDQQHPDLAHLRLVDVGSGWDNSLYRLGAELAVRLPRRALAAPLIEHEQRWLPQLAPRLPLPIPVPVRVGRPGHGFPWSWSVVPWLTGQPAAAEPPQDAAAAAVALAAFVCALHQPAPDDAPRNPVRGVPLAHRTAAVHARATDLDGLVNRTAVLDVWDEVVRAPTWSGPPLWIHGDLHAGNVLVDRGRVSAIIDFGDLTAGDPATDLSIAWTLLPTTARSIFRTSVTELSGWVDGDTWIRARGWALTLGLAFLASSRDNALMSLMGRNAIEAVLSEIEMRGVAAPK